MARSLCLVVASLGMFQLSLCEEYLNVNGGPLGFCSIDGTALTGFTRDGHCRDLGNDDEGSHHICIKMPTSNNFCTVTGQPNWCAQDQPCQGQKGMCPIHNWCICQWAFISYLERAGGCDAVDQIKCEATNMAALTAYRRYKRYSSIQAALSCLESKCNITQTFQDQIVFQ